MKIIVYLCVAFLPSIIHCSSSEYDSNGKKIDQSLESEQLKKLLNEMAQNNRIVNDIFKPSLKGFLGFGSYGTIYKGTLLYPNTKEIEVAMKFTHIKDEIYADKEYEIYSYLNAIDVPEVELYGIPSVYYYGTWDNYKMMAITLLDSELGRNHRAGTLNEIDLLIVCKEFVRALKYMHSCGVHHGDIRFVNLMFRRNNGFIIDFNTAEKMYNTTKLDTSSRRIGIQKANIDWRAFLQSLNDYCGVDILLERNISKPETESQIHDIMTKIEKENFYEETKIVSLEMAKHIFGKEDSSIKNDNTSAYDRIYEVIEEEIRTFGDTPTSLLHWLTKQEESLAKEEYVKNPTQPISSIPDPLKLTTINYPEVKWNYFRNKISQLKSGKSSSKKQKIPNTSCQSSKSDSIKKRKQ